MARIFTIEFTYKGMAQHAMVSVRTTPFFTEYTVSMLSDEIGDLLPNNKIISTAPDSFVFSDSTAANSPQLMDVIILAVKEHIQAMHA